MQLSLLAALISVLAAIGVFAWLVVERLRYYGSGDKKHKMRLFIATFVCIFLLMLAIGLYMNADRGSAY